MKLNTSLIILTLCFTTHAFSNKIDELKNDKDVEDFVKVVVPEFAKKNYKNYDYGNFSILPTDIIYQNISCDKIFRASDFKNWQKLDINNDGLTDLLFIAHYYGYQQYAIIDKGDNFELKYIGATFDLCQYLKPIKVKKMQAFAIRKVHVVRFVGDTPQRGDVSIDTLTYKFDAFVEFNNKKPALRKIKTIKLKITSPWCYNQCSEIEIKGDGQVNSTGSDTKNPYSESSFKLDDVQIQFLEELLNYIAISDLKNNYSLGGLDYSTAHLDVIFDDDSSKKIVDYGMTGTFGLAALYQKLSEIGNATTSK